MYSCTGASAAAMCTMVRPCKSMCKRENKMNMAARGSRLVSSRSSCWPKLFNAELYPPGHADILIENWCTWLYLNILLDRRNLILRSVVSSRSPRVTHFTMPGPNTNVCMAGAHTDHRKSPKFAENLQKSPNIWASGRPPRVTHSTTDSKIKLRRSYVWYECNF